MMASIVSPCSPPVKPKNELREEHEEEEEEERVFPMNVESSSIYATLETKDLWKQFDDLSTEMIVTRRGRRMFPPIKVDLNGLKPSASYILLMDLVPVDKYRYKYQNSSWVKCFEESCSPTRLYVHPESPAPGSYWMDHVISFYKLKLTNNQLDKQGHIIVNSMHRYQPRLHIVESNDIQNLNWENFTTIIFPGTKFTTVTAYQNDKITQLKIENNPFAKGFRHPMSRHRMRTNHYSQRSNSESGSEEVSLCANPVVSLAEHTRVLKRPSNGSDDELPAKQIHIATVANEGVIQVQENPAVIKNPHINGSVPMYIMYANPLTSSPQTATTIIPNRTSPITTISNEASVSSNSIKGPANFQVLQIANSNKYPIPPLRQDVIQTPISKIYRSPTTLVRTDPTERASVTSTDSSSTENDSDSDMSHSPQIPSPPPLKMDITSSPKLVPVACSKPPVVQNSPLHIARASTASPNTALGMTTMEAIPQQSIIIQAAPHGYVNNLGSTKLLVPVSMPQAKSSTLIQPNGIVIPDQQHQLPMMQTVPIFQMGGQFSAVQAPMQFIALTTSGAPQLIQNNSASS